MSPALRRISTRTSRRATSPVIRSDCLVAQALLLAASALMPTPAALGGGASSRDSTRQGMPPGPVPAPRACSFSINPPHRITLRGNEATLCRPVELRSDRFRAAQFAAAIGGAPTPGGGGLWGRERDGGAAE